MIEPMKIKIKVDTSELVEAIRKLKEVRCMIEEVRALMC